MSTAAIASSRPTPRSAPERYPPASAPTTDGGAIHPNSRQLIRPARTWPIEAAEAATPDTAMFAAPPDAVEDANSSMTGRRRLPSTRPTAPPAKATRKHQTAMPIASGADTREECSSRAPLNVKKMPPSRSSPVSVHS